MDDIVKAKLKKFFCKYPKLQFTPKKVIIRPQDKIEHIYFLESGEVKQYVGTLKGEEITIHAFSPGSYFPAALLISNTANEYYFETLNNITVYKAPAGAVLELIKSDNDICFDLAVRLSTGLSKILLKIESTLYQDSYYKVVTILLYLAKKFGKKADKMTVINIHLTHYDIASWVGIQRETASRQIEVLMKKKLITYENQLISVDLEKLSLEEREYKYYMAKK